MKVEFCAVLLFISLTSCTDWRKFFSKYSGKCPPFLGRFCTGDTSSSPRATQQEQQFPESMKYGLLDALVYDTTGVWTPYFDKNIPYHASFKESYIVDVKNDLSAIAIYDMNTRKMVFLNGTSYGGEKFQSIFTFTNLSRENDFSTELFGNYVTFRVRGRSEVTVKLLSHTLCYEISIGVITNNYIGINECTKEFSSTVFVEEGLLDSKDSKGFWVYWNENGIMMGLERELEPRIRVGTTMIPKFHKVEYSSKKKVDWKAPSFNVKQVDHK
ncbi:hypothetical protein ACFFRR_004190 [Megaselia abdita]